VKLGEIEVSGLGLGGNVFGWTADRAESFAVLDAFADAGGTMIDTADAYSAWVPGNSGGESEDIIGRWLTGRDRDRFVVATKVCRHSEALGLSRASIRAGCEASLRRLRTDRIDLYYAHFDDPDTPLAETFAAFDELVREGKVRHVAASNYPADRLAEALALVDAEGLAPIVAYQAHYNLVRRASFERGHRDLLAGAGVATIPYYALANGFLTGKYRSVEDLGGGARDGAARRYLDERGLRVLAALDDVAAAHDTRPAAIALAWLTAQPTVAVPLASARTPAQLRDLLAFTEVTLTAAELAALGEASS
jgi:aryl-alcohol dehydrogenase-like predicted oxidoreductase